MTRHFLTGEELNRDEQQALLARAAELKAAPRSSRALEDKVVALLFEKPSTRTRLSFEAGVVELGGHPMILRPGEMQLARGEAEVARGQRRAVLWRSEPLRPPRRHLLQQRDVPPPARDEPGVVVEERPARPGLREPVEEVPGEDVHARVGCPP